MFKPPLAYPLLLILYCALTNAPAEEVVTEIDEQRLLQVLECTSTSPATLSNWGVSYGLSCPGTARTLVLQRVDVAVHPSVEAAAAFIKYRRDFSARPRDASEHRLGEESWMEGRGPTMLAFRRRNVTMRAEILGFRVDCIRVLQHIDQMIANDRDFAPLGEFTPLPRITASGFPAQLVNMQPVSIQPQFEGLSNPATVRLVIFHGELPESDTATPAGISLRPNGEPGRQLQYEVLAADDRNVFVSSGRVAVDILAPP